MEQEFDSFTKAGFARLLKIFENTEDVVRITRAFSLAARSHKGKKWNRSEPYINHPLRVALILAEELHVHNTELICDALLMDTSEDLADQLQEFGQRAAEISKLSSTEHVAKDHARESSLEQYYEQLSKASKEARYVKMAERLDAARTMRNIGLPEKAARFKDETQKYLMPIAERTDDKLAFKLSLALYELK